MLEKQREVGQKATDKVQKACDELLRERDAIHKELKKTESMLLFFVLHKFDGKMRMHEF